MRKEGSVCQGGKGGRKQWRKVGERHKEERKETRGELVTEGQGGER